jgi:hypothetical protein
MQTLLQQYQSEINTICKQNDVARLYAFGSVVNDSFNKNSDVDLFIELLPIQNPIVKGEHLLKIWDEFELLFGRKVDLVSTTKLKNKIFEQQLNTTKQLIYDRAS